MGKVIRHFKSAGSYRCTANGKTMGEKGDFGKQKKYPTHAIFLLP